MTAGLSDGEGDWSSEIPGVLCIDTERPEDGVRRSNPCGTVPEAKTSTHQEMPDTVSHATRRPASTYVESIAFVLKRSCVEIAMGPACCGGGGSAGRTCI